MAIDQAEYVHIRSVKATEDRNMEPTSGYVHDQHSREHEHVRLGTATCYPISNKMASFHSQSHVAKGDSSQLQCQIYSLI